jgi:GNAT superfamily N-acetyltransferase
MKTNNYILHTDKNFSASEFGSLASLQGWGDVDSFTEEIIVKHLSSVSFSCYIRHQSGVFVGYVSGIDNALFSVFIDAMLTHPEYDRDVVGRMLLEAILKQFSGTPVYAMPFVDEQDILLKQGFKTYARPMAALANRSALPNKSKIVAIS